MQQLTDPASTNIRKIIVLGFVMILLAALIAG